MNIEEYRTRLEEFIEALHREYYLHYSGQKELLETGASYSEFSDLFSLDRIREIQGEIEKIPPHFESHRPVRVFPNERGCPWCAKFVHQPRIGLELGRC